MQPTKVEHALSFDSEHKRRAENLAFDIDVWYPQLREFTFPTLFIPLKIAEAHAIVHCYQQRFTSRRGAFTREDAQCLKELEHRVDVVLQEEDVLHAGAFPRLCGRSLKDADPFRPEHALQAYRQLLQERRDANTGSPPEMEALFRVDWMKVHTGAEVLSLLLSSERAFIDLKDWIEFGEPEQLALRQWQPELTQELEFRIFVYESKLTGISQYDHYCHYPFLETLKSKLEGLIVDFWHRFHNYVGIESYVADIGYLSSTDSLILVELGPFLPCTGASCFRWGQDMERLRHGPREFRLRTAQDALSNDTVAELVGTVVHNWQQPPPPYQEALDSVLFVAADAELHLGRCALQRWVVMLHSIAAAFASSVPAVALHRHRAQRPTGRLLFVYGTLKRGFHWNNKFLSSRASFVGEAVTTEPWPLVIGRCGVPYVLLKCQEFADQQCVRGEVWLVDEEELAGLDDYEGISKGYYSRERVPCRITSTDSQSIEVVQAEMYGAVETHHLWNQRDLAALRCIQEYTLDMHSELYRPIEHIQLKQQLYLANARCYNSTYNHARPLQKS